MRAHATGVDSIDEVLGGITPGLPCVIAGPAGSGRTVLSLQLAAASLLQGRVVALLCNEPAPLLLRQAATLGLSLERAIESDRLALLEMDPAIAAITQAQGGEALVEAVRTEQPLCSLLIIDPLSVVTAGIFDEPKLRSVARGLATSVADWMVVLTVESERIALQPALERILGEVCGAYLVLSRDEDGRRRLRVAKTRTGVPRRPFVHFEIGDGGTRVLPASAGDTGTNADDGAERTTAAGADAAPRAPARAQPGETGDAHAHDPAVATRDDAGDGDETPPAPRTTERAARSAARPAARRRGEPDGEARPAVLVVDPDRATRELLSKWLEGSYEVVTAEDGFEAMTCLMSRSLDLVILDLLMPRVTGYELLSAIQRSRLAIPRLVVSRRIERPGDRLAPLVLGATDIVSKPLERFELLRKVELLLRVEGTPGDLIDPREAEDLFARISKSRLLAKDEFGARLERACNLGERLGLPSSLVAVSATGAAALDALLESADAALRFEDATLRVSQRRALVLLVATAPDDAAEVIERLVAGLGGRSGRAEAISTTVHTARRVDASYDWHALFRGGRRGSGEEADA